MQQYRNPKWWTPEYDSAWDRMKEAFRRDWSQTKHDFGGDEPDLNQDVDDTVKQAAGKQPIPPRYEPNYEDYEPAFRFGFGARRYYGKTYAAWDETLETKLHDDWKTTHTAQGDDWKRYRKAIRKGWDYQSR
jgi:hypothetical protein